MFEIINRYTKVVLYKSEASSTVREATVEAVKSGADLSGADLSGADLRGADLRGADLSGADLRGAYLRDAYLRGADLSGADLRDAYLRGAYLRDAYLRGADLSGADLRDAYLRDADLRDAYLRDADLRGADLRGAKGPLSNPVPPLQIIGTMHPLIVREDGCLTIGCHHETLVWWEEHYANVGREEGYTDKQVSEYRAHIAHARQWMEQYGVANVIDKTKEVANG
jgi:Pentapeptide repeats (8 copies)